MNWDRRSFVKFAVGAAMGFGASPLALKLTDDAAIWTQNWPWVPNPETGGKAVASTINPATGTGVNVKLINARLSGERIIRVEGNPEHPLSQGGIIPADASAPQLAYYRTMRVTQPVVRKMGVRAPVKAELAVEVIAAAMAELANRGQAPSIGIIADDPFAIHGEMLMRLMSSLGSPNLVFLPSPQQALGMAGTLMLGQPELGFDLMNADFCLSVGTPLLQGWGAPVTTRKAFAAWRSGEKPGALVQVEPRASITASQADLWLACRPGTEGAVAMAIAGLMLESGAYDKSVQQAAGFDEYKALIKRDYTLEKAAQITGVNPSKLAAAAEGFVAAAQPVAVCGQGQAGEPGHLFTYLATLGLNALRGRIGKEGGVVARQPLPLKPLGEPMNLPPATRLDGGGQRLMGAYNVAAFALNALGGKPYGLDLLITVNTNPVFAGPQAKLMRALADRVPMLVSISQYMDETAEMADVVLPAGSFLESWGDCGTPYGSPVSSYGVHRPLLNIVPEARSTGDWILAIAQKLGGPAAQALPFESTQEALAARTAEMGDFEEISQRGWWVQEKPSYGDIAAQTTSGKMEMLAAPLSKGVKLFAPPPVDEHYPLLLAGIPSLRTGDGGEPMSPYMLKVLSKETLAHKDQLVVEMNPFTAAELGLHEGSMIKVASRAGEATARLHLFHGAAPGMVFAPVGLGHSAFGFYLQGKGANYFELAQVTEDPMSGLPQWGLTPVSVTKAGDSNHV